MMIKSARAELKVLMEAAFKEQQDNIKLAHENARCGFDDMKPYSSTAQRDLIRGVNELVALAEQSGG
jgi:hypothetical protein